MILKKIDLSTARAFFNSFEHLGNCGLGVWHWGAYESGRMIGAVSFGTTCFARPRGFLSGVADHFGLAIWQVCRGGTVHTAAPNTPSRVLSGAMRELRRDRGDCLIVAYSDKSYNEVGTIYQACNAVYTGQTKPKGQSDYLMGGKTLSGWVVRKKYGTRALERLRKVDPGVVKVPLSPKYRYVFIQAPRRKKAKITKALRPYTLFYPDRKSENIEHMNVADLVSRRYGRVTRRVGDRRTVIYASGATTRAYRPAKLGGPSL